jgi:hypothetical protein
MLKKISPNGSRWGQVLLGTPGGELPDSNSLQRSSEDYATVQHVVSGARLGARLSGLLVYFEPAGVGVLKHITQIGDLVGRQGIEIGLL